MRPARLAAAVVLLALWVVHPVAAQSDDDDTSSVAPPPTLGRPIIRPAPSSELGRGVVLPAQPEIARPLPAPVITSPVTGYGVGGMQQMPGSPPNPPYTSAPLILGH